MCMLAFHSIDLSINPMQVFWMVAPTQPYGDFMVKLGILAKNECFARIWTFMILCIQTVLDSLPMTISSSVLNRQLLEPMFIAVKIRTWGLGFTTLLTQTVFDSFPCAFLEFPTSFFPTYCAKSSFIIMWLTTANTKPLVVKMLFIFRRPATIFTAIFTHILAPPFSPSIYQRRNIVKCVSTIKPRCLRRGFLARES